MAQFKSFSETLLNLLLARTFHQVSSHKFGGYKAAVYEAY